MVSETELEQAKLEWQQAENEFQNAEGEFVELAALKLLYAERKYNLLLQLAKRGVLIENLSK